MQKRSKQSEETKAKISASHIGLSQSEETKAKISASHIGLSQSEETKAKISATVRATCARKKAQQKETK